MEEFGQDTQCPGRPESPTVPSREQLVTLWAVLAPLHAGLACGETPRHLVSEDLFPVLRPRRSTVSWSPGLACAGAVLCWIRLDPKALELPAPNPCSRHLYRSSLDPASSPGTKLNCTTADTGKPPGQDRELEQPRHGEGPDPANRVRVQMSPPRCRVVTPQPCARGLCLYAARRQLQMAVSSGASVLEESRAGRVGGREQHRPLFRAPVFGNPETRWWFPAIVSGPRESPEAGGEVGGPLGHGDRRPARPDFGLFGMWCESVFQTGACPRGPAGKCGPPRALPEAGVQVCKQGATERAAVSTAVLQVTLHVQTETCCRSVVRRSQSLAPAQALAEGRPALLVSRGRGRPGPSLALAAEVHGSLWVRSEWAARRPVRHVPPFQGALGLRTDEACGGDVRDGSRAPRTPWRWMVGEAGALRGWASLSVA